MRGFDAALWLLASWLLACLAVPPGASARRWWLMLAAGLFHFGASEWYHCQPDGWMLTPALGALLLRTRRWTGGRGLPELEGALWGVACSLKPFPAVAALLAAATAWAAGGRGFRTVVLEEWGVPRRFGGDRRAGGVGRRFRQRFALLGNHY